MVVKIFVDGGVSGGNKEDAPCYYAYVAYIAHKNADDVENLEEVASRSKVDKGTSNQAEYKGLLLALADLNQIKMKVDKDLFEDIDVLIYSDSKIMVNQVNGDYKIKDKKLKSLCELVDESRYAFEDDYIYIGLEHIRRELNPITDLLCNLAKKNIIKTNLFQSLKDFKKQHNLQRYKALKEV